MGWVTRTVAALSCLERLPPDWDSYGAPPVSRESIAAATQLLARLAGLDIEPPTVVPTAKGTVQFEWHGRGACVEVEPRSGEMFDLYAEDDLSGDVLELYGTTDINTLARWLARFESLHG